MNSLENHRFFDYFSGNRCHSCAELFGYGLITRSGGCCKLDFKLRRGGGSKQFEGCVQTVALFSQNDF